MNEREIKSAKKFATIDRSTPLADGGEVPQDTQAMSSDQAPQDSLMPAQIDASQQSKVINPEGEMVSIPSEQLSDASSLGYRIPSPEEVTQAGKIAKYGTPAQQAVTFAEAAGRGVIGPLAPSLEEAAGIDPEAIRTRQDVNPIASATGEIAGLAGSMGTGVGMGAMVAHAGELAAGALEGASMASKIGSAAVKGLVENSLIQSGNEASKMIMQDPNQSAQTAMIDIGLAGLIGGGIGGGIGSVNPLWHATMGAKVGTFLETLQKRAGGIEGMLPDEVNSALQQSGINVDPVVKSALSADPEMRSAFQLLQESSTESGKKAQEALKGFKNTVSDTLGRVLGKTPEDIGNLSELSEYDSGQSIKKELIDSLKATIDPISDKFEAIKNKYKNIDLEPMVKDEIGTQIGNLVNTEGYGLSPSSPQFKAIQKTLEELPNIKTLEDLRKYQSILGDSTKNPEMWRVGGQLKGILRNVEEEAVMDRAKLGAPEELFEHQDARSAYRNAMTSVDLLNDRLRVGRYSGPSSFIKALKDLSPEDVIRRLNPTGDASLITDLQQIAPNVADQLRNFHISKILKSASSKALPGEVLNSKAVFNAMEKMSPEMRSFIMPGDTAGQVEALRTLVEAIPSKMNTSGTAKTLDALWNHIPGSAIGMASMLLGHGPLAGAAGYLMGHLSKLLSRDAPDAIRLSMLKFMGSAKPIESSAFDSMVGFIHSAIKGETLLNRSTKNLFKASAEVLPRSFLPSSKEREKIVKAIKAYREDPSPLLDITGNTGHYMPDHATATGQLAATATTYLNSIMPESSKAAPLDAKTPVDPSKKAAFDRALNIAQQPLVVYEHLKSGTLIPQDVQTLQAIYPAVYDRMKQKVMAQIVEQTDKDKPVPYNLRGGLSLFLGQPLDSTFTPQSIIAAQMVGKTQQPSAQQQLPKQKRSTAILNKFSSTYRTPEQMRAQARATRD